MHKITISPLCPIARRHWPRYNVSSKSGQVENSESGGPPGRITSGPKENFWNATSVLSLLRRCWTNIGWGYSRAPTSHSTACKLKYRTLLAHVGTFSDCSCGHYAGSSTQVTCCAARAPETTAACQGSQRASVVSVQSFQAEALRWLKEYPTQLCFPHALHNQDSFSSLMIAPAQCHTSNDRYAPQQRTNLSCKKLAMLFRPKSAPPACHRPNIPKQTFP